MSTLRKALSRLSTSIGLAAFAGASRDVKLLCAQRLVRLFAYGSSTLILVLHLKALGHAEWAIGLFMTLTLVGNVILSILLTAIADRAGRRRLLIGGALCMAVSGLVFVFGTAWPLLLAAATFGMISPRLVMWDTGRESALLMVCAAARTLGRSRPSRNRSCRS